MVEYIEIKKEKYPVRISYTTLLVMQKKAGGTNGIEKLIDEDVSVLEEILYMGLKSGAYAVDEEMKFKREEMSMVLDECFADLIKLLPKFFEKFKNIKEENEGKDKPSNFQKQVKQMKKAKK